MALGYPICHLLFLDRSMEHQHKHMIFHVVTASDNKPIEKSSIQTTTLREVMTGFTDNNGLVKLGPFFDQELVAVEVKTKGYDKLVKEFKYSSTMDSITLEMI